MDKKSIENDVREAIVDCQPMTEWDWVLYGDRDLCGECGDVKLRVRDTCDGSDMSYSWFCYVLSDNGILSMYASGKACSWEDGKKKSIEASKSIVKDR